MVLLVMALLVTASAMALLVTESAMALLVMLLLTQLPMPLLRSTPTRSRPTPTSMPWLTTTLDPVLTPRRLTMAPLPGRDTTPSTFLTEGSSTSTTTPTTLMDMSPKSLTMELLHSPLLSLVSAMASPTVVSSAMALPTVVLLAMASPTVALSVMVWWATVSELPTEELPTSAKQSFTDFQDTRDTTQDDRQRKQTDKILDNIFPIFIYLLINMNTS